MLNGVILWSVYALNKVKLRSLFLLTSKYA